MLLRVHAQDQRHDVLPEIWSGHNVADFVDPDIEEKLRALERDEDAAAAEHERLVRVLRGFCAHCCHHHASSLSICHKL